MFKFVTPFICVALGASLLAAFCTSLDARPLPSLLTVSAVTAQSPKKSPAKTATKPSSSAKTTKSSKSSGVKSSAKPAEVASKPKTTAANTTDLSSTREELRGIWITTDSPRDWDAVMKKLKESGLNAAFVRIGQSTRVIYPSKIVPQDQWSAESGEDELGKAVAAARRYGIQFHAWKVCFTPGSSRSRPPGSPALAFYERMVREDRIVRDHKGNPGQWLNPSDPRNQDLEVAIAKEVVAKYPVHGYHLDYIRYPADQEPSTDHHYGAVSRREFEKAISASVKNWPDDVISGSLKVRYEDWERDNLTRLVGRIRDEVRSARPGTLMSAAVWRKVYRHRAILKQDWPRWCREGLVDFVVPMAYEADTNEFRTVVSRDFSQMCGTTPFVVGIGSYLIRSPQTVVEQVQATRDLGADGFVLFSFNDPTFLNGDKKPVLEKGLVDRQLKALATSLTRTAVAPGVGGQQFRFRFSDGVLPRRYQNLCVESGKESEVRIELAKSARGAAPLTCIASIEDLKGRRRGEPQKLTFEPGKTHALTFTATTGAVRPVVRGTLGEGKSAQPFVFRGPIVEPLSRSELTAVRSQAEPPARPANGLVVGIYENGIGADGIFEILEQAKGVAPVRVHRLELEHMKRVDVLIVPQFFDLADLNSDATRALRDWVSGGGKLMLTHDAVGLRWHPRLFPEVGKGVKLVTTKRLEVVHSLSGLPRGTQFDHEYSDHAQLETASSAKVIVTEHKSGRPVVAAGRVGKGLVILNGLIPGHDAEANPQSQSARLLRSLVHYR